MLSSFFRMRTVVLFGVLIALPSILIVNALQGDIQQQAQAHTYAERTTRTLHSDDAIVNTTSNTITDVFDEPVVSIVFDGGWESVYQQAFPLLEQYGINSTQFIITGTFDDPQYMSVDQIAHMHAYGHQIGSHTVTHRDLTSLSGGELSSELYDSRVAVETLTQEAAEDLSAPLGAYNDETLQATRIWYRSLRTTEAGVNTRENFDAYRLLSPTIVRSDTVADIERYLEKARETNGWLILAYQQIGDSEDTYSVHPEMFRKHLDAIVASGIDIQRYGDVLDMIKEQHQ